MWNILRNKNTDKESIFFAYKIVCWRSNSNKKTFKSEHWTYNTKNNKNICFLQTFSLTKAAQKTFISVLKLQSLN